MCETVLSQSSHLMIIILFISEKRKSCSNHVIADEIMIFFRAQMVASMWFRLVV